MPLNVEHPKDWEAIASIGGPVVDPMIVRCGELFLRGAKGASSPVDAWDLLTRNVHAIGTFFDRLIIEDQIPVFNYADTFDIGQNFNRGTLGRINDTEEVLVDVNVRYGAYQEVKSAALQELKKLYGANSQAVEANDAENILGELTASGYAWYPQLGDLALRDEREQRLAAFILGGLIFGAYAQRAGTGHLMQPKRSRLFLAISLGERPNHSAEEYLFENLGNLTGRPTAEVPYTPTFFPLLLQMSDGPGALLENALEMRRSGEARDYRAWLGQALEDFSRNGRISTARVKEVEKIATAVRRKLDGVPAPNVEIKTTVADVVGARLPGVSVNLTPVIKAGWGWVVDQLPGNRHRKLLTRAIVSDGEYRQLDRRVHTVWQGDGVRAD